MLMLDNALARARDALTDQLRREGFVEQARAASRLFAGDFSEAETVGHQFGDSVLGIGVMHDILGEVVSLRGETWRVPVTGVPTPVAATDGVAFAVAAHGGRRHRLRVLPGSDLKATQLAVDDYLFRHHHDSEQVVCAIEMRGQFSDVVLRTVAPPRYEGETLGEIIDDEARFVFPSWTGTMVGFRFPDSSEGEVIPGLHLHGIADNRQSGGHLRSMIAEKVTTHLWIDELHPIRDRGTGEVVTDAGPIDFDRYEGPVGNLDNSD